MTDAKLNRRKIIEAFGLTEEDMAAFESTPEAVSYRNAKAQADAEREAFSVWLEKVAEKLSEEKTRELREAGLLTDDQEIRFG